MAGVFGWLKEVLFLGSKNPKPAPAQRQAAPRAETKVRVQRPSRSSYGVQRIDTVQLRSYNEAGVIADILREGVTAVVNVQNLSSTDRARLTDFMAGLKAGLLAQSQRVAEDVYLLAPENVDIEPDLEEPAEDEGDRLIIRP